jgi:hypothetical protein
MRLLTLLFLLLAACGGGNQDANDDSGGFGKSFDARVANGLRVRYANDRPPRIDKINAFYIEVADCMGLQPEPGPLVIIVEGLIDQFGANGKLYYPETIVIDAQVTTIFPFELTAIAYPFKHEFVHYLLNRSGFPQDRNFAHDSQFFDLCGH